MRKRLNSHEHKYSEIFMKLLPSKRKWKMIHFIDWNNQQLMASPWYPLKPGFVSGWVSTESPSLNLNGCWINAGGVTFVRAAAASRTGTGESSGTIFPLPDCFSAFFFCLLSFNWAFFFSLAALSAALFADASKLCF